MSCATIDPPVAPEAGRILRLRLAFGAVVWRVAAGVVLVKELIYWAKSGRFPGVGVPRRVGYLFYKLPESLVVALVAATATAVALELLVRYLTGPRMTRWLRPRDDGSFAMPYAFRLEATERVAAEWPARRRRGRSWAAGTLVLTDRALRFFPHAWDAEPWSVGRDVAVALAAEPAPPMSWGFVDGLPDRLVLRDGGRSEAFWLLDPDRVLARLDAGVAAAAR